MSLLRLLTPLALLAFTRFDSVLSTSDDWTASPSLSVPRSDFRALTLNDAVYLLGGCTANQTVGGSCEHFTQALTVFNFTTNSYSELTPLPNPDNRIRTRYGAAIMGTDLLFIGGRDQNDQILHSIDVFDTVTNTWVSEGVLGSETNLERSDGCVFVIGKSIFYAGGYDSSYTAYSDVYVLDTSLVTSGKRYGSFVGGLAAQKPYASGDCGATAIYGKGYVFGGFTNDGFVAPRAWLERYTPATNSWEILADFNHARGASAFALIAGNLFIVGGEYKVNRTYQGVDLPAGTYWSAPAGDVEHYNILTNKWTEVSELAVPRFRTTAAVWNERTEIFNFGGQGEYVITDASDFVNGAYFPVLNSAYHLDVRSFIVNVSSADVGNGLYSGVIGNNNTSNNNNDNKPKDNGNMQGSAANHQAAMSATMVIGVTALAAIMGVIGL